MTRAIEVEHLTKTYRVSKKAAGFRASLKALFSRETIDVNAVVDLSFGIEAGERVGFLGPNGAGKTTTLKMLSGLPTPTGGQVKVLGLDPRGRPHALLRQITLVMGQKQQLMWDLPPIETMELNRAVYDLDRTAYKTTLDQLTTMLGLSEVLEKPTRQLSLGERMKCELAAALLHQPRVLFLYEPTIGLDVTMQATVRRFIKEYNETTGATILLTSHDMDDVTALCPRVIVIDKGRLRHDGDLAALIAQTSPDKRIAVTLAKPVEDAVLAALGPLRWTRVSPMIVSVLAAPADLPATMRTLLDGLPISDLRVEDPPLEDVMQQVFGR